MSLLLWAATLLGLDLKTNKHKNITIVHNIICVPDFQQNYNMDYQFFVYLSVYVVDNMSSWR